MTRVPLLLNRTGQYLLFISFHILFVRREVTLQSDQPNKLIWSVWSCKCGTICCISENYRKKIREVWESDFALWALAFESRAGPLSSWFSFPNRFWQQTDKDILVQPHSPPHRDKRTVSPAGLSILGIRRGMRAHWTQDNQPNVYFCVLQSLIMFSCLANSYIWKHTEEDTEYPSTVLRKISQNSGNLYEHKWR